MTRAGGLGGHRFPAVPGYLNTASVGVPPYAAVDAVRRCLDDWQQGRSDPPSFDAEIDRARRAYAALACTEVGSVSIVSQVSVVSGVVASSLPDGATVLAAEEDFTSLLFPFLADPRLDVRLVPLDQLLDHLTPSVDLVAVSAVQSSDGRVIDLNALAQQAAAAQSRTYVDVTQAAGWMPIDATRFDVTACGAYKWLCSLRGSGFMTVGDESGWLSPQNAGWYAGDDPWESVYGPPLRLADDARRFNVSPAWFDFVSAAWALETLLDIGIRRIHEHNVGLANALRTRIGLQDSNSAIVSVDTPHGATLAEAGVTGATRAGKVRLSFHLYNSVKDVELAASVLAG